MNRYFLLEKLFNQPSDSPDYDLQEIDSPLPVGDGLIGRIFTYEQSEKVFVRLHIYFLVDEWPEWALPIEELDDATFIKWYSLVYLMRCSLISSIQE